MIEADHHPSLHADFGKFLPKLASYVNYLFAEMPYTATIPDSIQQEISEQTIV